MAFVLGRFGERTPWELSLRAYRDCRSPMTIVPVVLCDAHRLFRAGLKRLLPAKRYQTAFEADSMLEAQRWLRAHPDEASLFICDPAERDNDDRGYALFAEIIQEMGGLSAIVLTDQTTQEILDRVIEAGARGLLSKSISESGLQRALDLILLDDSVFLSPALLTTYMPGPPHGAHPETELSVSNLSKRERDIMLCLVQGMSNEQIGRALQVTERAIKLRRELLRRKLNASNRVASTISAVDAGAMGHGDGTDTLRSLPSC